jgi:hypothetical protein
MTHVTPVGSERAAPASEPRGGRIGVAFDWGFGVQIAAAGVAQLLSMPQPGGAPTSPLIGLGLLAASAVPFIQGEALRRGSGIAWGVQIAGNSLLTIGGVGLLVQLATQIAQGNFGLAVASQLYPLLLLLVVSPLEVWLLLQPGSRAWYGRVSPADARAHHSGAWLRGTVAWALVGGLLQFAAAYGSASR